MKRPDLDDLLAGLPAEERARLERAHEALLAAGAPPELPERLARAPRPAARVFALPRRPVLGWALATAAAAAAFAVGFYVGDGDDSFREQRTVAMQGVGPAGDARASLAVGEPDSVGNTQVVVRVRGLEPLADGWYELLVTREGKPVALCGTFAVRPEGETEVRLTIPYDLDRYDGWVVQAYDLETHESGPVLLRTREV